MAGDEGTPGSVAANEALARRFMDGVWDRGELARAADLLGPAEAAAEQGWASRGRAAICGTCGKTVSASRILSIGARGMGTDATRRDHGA